MPYISPQEGDVHAWRKKDVDNRREKEREKLEIREEPQER
jgi:hypothetical protein